MKIRVVSSREEIFTLNPNERIVHLTFRPSNKDIFGLVETCPKIEVIQLPKSYMATVSKSIEMFLEMQRIQLLEGDVWGNRTDINEYYTCLLYTSDAADEEDSVDLGGRRIIKKKKK